MKQIKIQNHIFERVDKSKRDLRQDVHKAFGDAHEMLYNLDLKLSNSFVGDGGERDKAIKSIRKTIDKALKSMKAEKYIPDMRKLG